MFNQKVVAALILILAGAALLWFAAGTLITNFDHAAPETGERGGLEDSGEEPAAGSAGAAADAAGCPLNPSLLEARRAAAAPDNTVSGGPGGTPEALGRLHLLLERKIEDSHYPAVHLSLYDFASGGQIKIKAHEPFYPASMIKTLLLLTALEQVDRGRVSLDDTHTLAERDKYAGETRVTGSGTLQYAEPGTVYTFEELLSLMVGVSDNVAANILFDWIGPEHIEATARRLELKNTAFTRKMFDLQSEAPSNRATAFELTRMLVALENAEIAPGELSRKGIAMMLDTKDKRIGRYTGERAAVANKVGTASSVIGDMALLYFPGRPPIALTIAVADPPDWEEAAAFIGELAALITELLLGIK